jgi:hypothetical protein
MEQEPAFLRWKIAAMALEKRGEHVGNPIEELEDDEEDEDEDEDEDENEKPKPPEIPETFPMEAWAPEPSRKTQDASAGTTPAGTTPAVETSHASSSPKLNVFVPVQQPRPQHVTKPAQGTPIPQNVPYPTFSTPQPERQHYQPSLPQFSAPPAPATLNQETSKTGLSISGGISIKYNRESAQSQALPSMLAPNVIPRPASVPPPQNWQHSNMNQGNPVSLPGPHPQQQGATYQAYNSHQRPPSAPTSPQQQVASHNQGVMVPYKPGPPQQSNTGLQTYNPSLQAPASINQYQQVSYLFNVVCGLCHVFRFHGCNQSSRLIYR